MTEPALENFTLIRPAPPFKALGIALDLLHKEKPFCDWDSKQLVSTVKGAIRRNHYILSRQGERYTGFACWGLCSEKAADGYLNGRYSPTYQDCLDGDHFLLFIIQAQQTKHFKEIVRFMKRHYPGIKVFGKRFHLDKDKLTPKKLVQR